MDARKYIQGLYQISAALELEDPLLEVIADYEDKLPGGYADQCQPKDFNQSQLLKGIKIELEHTDDPILALEIAMDHLTEIPNYYDHLENMEQEAVGGNMKVTKAELKMALASMGVEVIDDKIKRSDLNKVLGEKEAKRSFEPPKKWYGDMEKEIIEANPSYSMDQVSSKINDIWYKDFSDAKREELREKEGKEYGPSKEEE